MRRFALTLWIVLTIIAALMLVASCSSSPASSRFLAAVDAAPSRDGSLVHLPDAGPMSPEPTFPVPDCSSYCSSVMDHCRGNQAQYASREECLAFCARIPIGQTGDTDGNSIACRQSYAESPARTDSVTYCPAAGPFDSRPCGERCPVFCGMVLSVCSPGVDSGVAAPFNDYSECQTACLDFLYLDGGVDGGSGTVGGPTSGDSLNCRLYYLRQVLTTGSGCENLGGSSSECR